ncbi:hypothetical protein YPPY45_1427, partial [Yersinia pestis PY-45]
MGKATFCPITGSCASAGPLQLI